jgi:ORF6N domain
MPQKSKSPVPIEQIDGMIRTIRGVRVMLDRDLAQIYGVPTFRFNEAIKRNPESFRGSRRISCFSLRARSSIR